MQSPVEQIKNRLPIVDVISSYVELKENGNQWKGICPFHNEKTPSFFVSPERAGYYCFGCGAKGDIFSFVEQFEGLDFRGALKVLADRAGVSLSKTNEDNDRSNILYQVLEEATLFFENNLKKSAEAKEYLKTRGINEDSIKNFRIGYAPLAWSDLFTHLTNKGFKVNDIEAVGLIKEPNEKKDGPKRYYDRFRGRIMFPISDSSGRVIGFSGRILVDDGKQAKYLNSPDTKLFDKSSVLYGIDKAKFFIRKHNFSVLVEGQIDLVLSHQYGFPNTVALSGTAMSLKTENDKNVTNLGVVRGLSKNIILAFDRDQAGINASTRSAKIALSLGMDVKVASLPEGMDPAMLLIEKGASYWKDILKDSVNVILFELNGLAPLVGKKTLGGVIKQNIFPLIESIEGTMDQTFYIKKISEVIGLKEDAIWEDFRNFKATVGNDTIYRQEERVSISENKNLSKKDRLINETVGLWVMEKKKDHPLIDVSLIENELKRILGEDEFGNAISEISKNPETIFTLERFFNDAKNIKKGMEELLLNLEEALLREKKDLLLQKISVLGKDDKQDSLEYDQIMKKINAISEKRSGG